MSLSLIWNWQIPDWPKFTWNPARLEKAEHIFLMETGVFTGTVKHMPDTHRSQIVIEALTTEAATTSEIEGEVLDRASVQSSVRRELGFAPDKRRSGPKEQGIAEMMVDLHRTFAEPLSEEMLCRWHGKVMKGRPELTEIGRYRTDERPMEIVSGGSHAPKVHFEAPPSSRVKKEMARFVKWHNRTAPGGREPLPALARAGIAHLYFESIHPFEDGNGRIGRAISEKALAQSLDRPTLTALAADDPAAPESLLRGARAGEPESRDHAMAGVVRGGGNRGAAADDGADRVSDRQDAAVGPPPRRVERAAGEGAVTDAAGGAGGFPGRSERRKLRDDHGSVAGDRNARPGGDGREGRAAADGGAAACALFCGDSGAGSGAGDGRRAGGSEVGSRRRAAVRAAAGHWSREISHRHEGAKAPLPKCRRSARSGSTR